LTSFCSGEDEGDGSLARPPMRLFGRIRNQLSFSSEAESSDSESDDSDNVDCDDGHVSSVQLVGGGLGDFDAEDDEEGEW
jgi:hypothetical protein